MNQEQVKQVLRLLADDRSELRSFLGEPDAWIKANASSMTAEEKEELRAVAADGMAYLETYTVAALGNQSERRFVSGTGLERRHFMVRAASALLAVPLTGVVVAPRALGATGSPSSTPFVTDTNCDDSGSGCVDNLCTNSACSDSNNCKDNGCNNTGGCQDETLCSDDECVNGSTTCNDDQCIDEACTNQNNCTDDPSCTDDSTCSNTVNCADDRCVDGVCENTSNCADNTTCLDQPSCTDSSICPDPADGSC